MNQVAVEHTNSGLNKVAQEAADGLFAQVCGLHCWLRGGAWAACLHCLL